MSAVAAAQAPNIVPPASRGGIAVSVVAVVGRMRLDGRLDEAAWSGADSIVDLRQREPREGAPASERTVVKVLRDADALYVAVRAYDGSAGALRATQLRRDADLGSDDNVTLLIDSFHDRRTAFVFATNPNGAMWDAQLNGLENLNPDWNGIWDVATSRDSLGWTAEFRIPFRTLRFRSGTDVSFGFNVQRQIRRKNETVLWQGWRRTEGLYQLLAEGELTALGVLARSLNLELKPYALVRTVAPEYDVGGTRTADGSTAARVGLDAKAALTPTLTADLTINTDFAQAEVDRQVINLTRFPTFFPEKREFFLESSGNFDFGTAQRAQLFYSRRIGLLNGAPVPIVAGARVTGRSGAFTIGVLDVRTAAPDDANDAVVRIKHDLLERGFVGAILINRSGPALAGNEQAAGLDLQLPLVVRGQNVVPGFWIAGTRTPGVPGTPLAWRLSTDYPNDLFDNFVSLYRIDPGFTPTLGYVRRTGIWETTGHLNWTPRPGVLGIRQLDLLPIPAWDILAGSNGSVTDATTWQTASFAWRPFGANFLSGDHAELNVLRMMDAPSDTFPVFRDVAVAPGRYWWTRGELNVTTSPGRPLSVGARVNWGTFYGGSSTDLELTGTWRGGGHVIVGANLFATRAELPGGAFTAVQAAGQLEVALNTRADFLAFVQFNNEARRADFNLRFHWTPKIGDDVFVVWNSGYSTDPAARWRFPSTEALGRPLNGALVVKAVIRAAW